MINCFISVIIILLGGSMLDKILDYQKLDSEIVGLENKLYKSADRERAAEIQKSLKDQHSRLVALENSAARANQSYKKASEKYAEYNKKLSELEKQIQVADEKQVGFYENAYRDFSSISSTLERDVTNLYTEIMQISKEYEEIIKRSKIERERFDRFKASYDRLKSEVEPEIEKFKKDLSKAEKNVNEELLKLYKQKRENRIFPVFVELNNSKCGGCRMEVSASKIGQMKNNKFGIIECENCGRYIYNK